MDTFKPARWFPMSDGSTLIALHDGFFAAKAEMIVDLAGEAETASLRAAEGDPTIDVNAYALRRDGQVILIDTGTGSAWGPALGNATRALAGLGVKPDSIDTILLTHPHGDHALGLLCDDGSLRYPNADVFCPAIDIDFFQSDRERDARGPAAAQSFEIARTVFAALGARLRSFSAGEVLPGIEAISLPGHTMGHSGLMVAGETLICGDVLHLPALQGHRPTIGTVFDLDPPLALQTRRTMLAMAAERRLKLLGMHTPFGREGSVTSDGEGFAVAFD